MVPALMGMKCRGPRDDLGGGRHRFRPWSHPPEPETPRGAFTPERARRAWPQGICASSIACVALIRSLSNNLYPASTVYCVLVSVSSVLCSIAAWSGPRCENHQPPEPCGFVHQARPVTSSRSCRQSPSVRPEHDPSVAETTSVQILSLNPAVQAGAARLRDSASPSAKNPPQTHTTYKQTPTPLLDPLCAQRPAMGNSLESSRPIMAPSVRIRHPRSPCTGQASAHPASVPYIIGAFMGPSR